MPSPNKHTSVFHAYDIRGRSPEEIDESFARRLGQALAGELKPRSVLVGRDMRVTSVALEKALVESFVERGVNVIRIGLCSTPMFNVSVALMDRAVDLGVMVTASHNPSEYNGFKLVRGDVSPIGEGSGMEEIAAAFEKADGASVGTGRRGEVTDDPQALRRYVDYILKLAQLPADMPPVKVAIDAGNGMAGAVLPELISRLSWLTVVPMYFEPDGRFPNHEANPLKRETLHDLSARVVADGCALGVAFDGDADRVGFVDETGIPIPGDLMTAVLAQELLRQVPGGEILYNVCSSWAVPEAILSAGGKPTMCRVGHAFIKRQMKESGAVFAGEMSMHYYFHTLANVESGDLVMLLVLRQLAAEKRPMSALWSSLQTYAHSGEINFTVADPAQALNRIAEAYRSKATTVSDLDGLRFEFRSADHPEEDWWFSLRKSNTEPLVRLNLETRTKELTQKKVQELSSLIRSA